MMSGSEPPPCDLVVIARDAFGQIITRITSHRHLVGAMHTARCVLRLKGRSAPSPIARTGVLSGAKYVASHIVSHFKSERRRLARNGPHSCCGRYQDREFKARRPEPVTFLKKAFEPARGAACSRTRFWRAEIIAACEALDICSLDGIFT